MLEFPKMLYREGEELLIEGKALATRIVHDAEAEAAAIKEGWQSLVAAIEGKPAPAKTKKG